MPDEPSYIAQVSMLRPDKDEALLEGSACRIRLEIETQLDNEGESDGLAIDCDNDDTQDELDFIAVGKGFLLAFLSHTLDRGFVCWCDVPGSAREWLWPKMARHPEDLHDLIQIASDDVLNRLGDSAPLVLIAVIPRDGEIEAVELIHRYRAHPHSLSLWRRILHRGVVTLRIGGSVCSIGIECDVMDQALSDVRWALSRAFLSSRWTY